MITSKDDIRAAIEAFFANGGQVTQVAEGERKYPEGIPSGDPSFDAFLSTCQCGCGGDYAEHLLAIKE